MKSKSFVTNRQALLLIDLQYDFVEEGLQTTVVDDGCRGVELQAGDIDRALKLMKSAGAQWVTSSTIFETKKK